MNWYFGLKWLSYLLQALLDGSLDLFVGEGGLFVYYWLHIYSLIILGRNLTYASNASCNGGL